jgi:Skp family chaperone for outer membrane proteins
MTSLSLLILHIEVKNMREEVFTLSNAQRMAKERMEKEIGPIHKDIENLQKDLKENRQKYEDDQLLLVKIKAEIPVLKTELSRATGFSGQGPYARNNL